MSAVLGRSFDMTHATAQLYKIQCVSSLYLAEEKEAL